MIVLCTSDISETMTIREKREIRKVADILMASQYFQSALLK
jgi:hypothetical protein